MKNIYKFLFLAVLIVSVSACEDIDKDPIPVNGTDGPFGSFIRLNLSTAAVLDVTNIDGTSFGGTLVAPSNNVASYDLKVRRVSNGEVSDYEPFFSTTTFPAEMLATPAALAAVFGVTSADLIPGDRFDFEATTVGTDGTVVTFDNFGPNLQGGPGQAQGYRFVTFLSCPFIQADAVGTYAITSTDAVGFADPGKTTFDVTSGPGDNITMVDPFGNLLPGDAADRYDVVINVNAGSGQAAVASQRAYDSGHPVFGGTPYGIGEVNGGGFVFSCAGAIVLNLQFTVAAGSFGETPYVGQKL